MHRSRGYTLVELIVIILMIAIGSTLILAIHTRLQRESLDSADHQNCNFFLSRLQAYEQKYSREFPSVEPYVSEPDRISRFADYRQRPGKALRLLLRCTGSISDENTDLRLLYSPMDGAMPDSVLFAMAPGGDPADKCYSSYAYDPGHLFSTDGDTVIFGHSPSFMRRHGRSTVRAINARLELKDHLEFNPEQQAYTVTVTLPSSPKTQLFDNIYEDQAGTLFNHDSYLSDQIPFR